MAGYKSISEQMNAEGKDERAYTKKEKRSLLRKTAISGAIAGAGIAAIAASYQNHNAWELNGGLVATIWGGLYSIECAYGLLRGPDKKEAKAEEPKTLSEKIKEKGKMLKTSMACAVALTAATGMFVYDTIVYAQGKLPWSMVKSPQWTYLPLNVEATITGVAAAMTGIMALIFAATAHHEHKELRRLRRQEDYGYGPAP